MQRPSIPYRYLVGGGAVALAFVLGSACGGAKHSSSFDDGSGADAGVGEGGLGLGSGNGTGACTGIACNVDHSCSGGADSTTISGTAYAPNGTLALYNVIAFVPNAPLTPFEEGVSCDTCGSVSGSPIVTTTSDSSGKFVLKGVPSGDNVPLVLQVGKWRRQVTIPHVEKCVDNPITDANLTRLPKNHTEGDMPHIAVTTGDCDKIACVLPRMGIDASEFGVASEYATKRVIFYQGEGSSTVGSGITGAQNLWADISELKKYDVAIFSCECSEHMENKTGNQGTVLDYLNAGGRTFGTDFMYTWIHAGVGDPAADAPPAPLPNLMQGFVGGAPGNESSSYSVDQTFPKGQALAEWLHAVGASPTVGEIPLEEVYANFGKVDPTLGQRWIYDTDHDDVVSYTTPFTAPEAQRCGKSYYLEPHVGPIDSPDTVDTTFPAGCLDDFTAQQKALVFFLMDLASCIQDDSQPVNPPR